MHDPVEPALTNEQKWAEEVSEHFVTHVSSYFHSAFFSIFMDEMQVSGEIYSFIDY